LAVFARDLAGLCGVVRRTTGDQQQRKEDPTRHKCSDQKEIDSVTASLKRLSICSPLNSCTIGNDGATVNAQCGLNRTRAPGVRYTVHPPLFGLIPLSSLWSFPSQ